MVKYPEVYGRLRPIPTLSPATIETHQGNPEFLDDCSHGRPINFRYVKDGRHLAMGHFVWGEILGGCVVEIARARPWVEALRGENRRWPFFLVVIKMCCGSMCAYLGCIPVAKSGIPGVGQWEQCCRNVVLETINLTTLRTQISKFG